MPCGYVMHKATLLLMSRFRNEYRIPFRQTPCRLTQKISASTSPDYSTTEIDPDNLALKRSIVPQPTLQLWVIMAVIFQPLNDCWSETIL